MNRTLSVLLVLAALVGATSLANAARRPEETRQALYDLMDRLEAQASGRADASASAERVRRALDGMTPAQLDVLARVYGATPSVQNALGASDTGLLIPRVDPTFSELCGSVRIDASVLKDQLDTWQDMQSAAAAAQGDCDAASSGDTSMDNATVCPVAATANDAAIVARFAYENSLLCNRDIDSAEVHATVGTVADIDAALGELVDVPSAIDELQMAILEALAEHDASVKAAIAEIVTGQQTILDQLAEIRVLLLTPPGRRPGWNGRPGNNGQGNGN